MSTKALSAVWRTVHSSNFTPARNRRCRTKSLCVILRIRSFVKTFF
jgi:hypothetical protein